MKLDVSRGQNNLKNVEDEKEPSTGILDLR
jgi:hypothetical protein